MDKEKGSYKISIIGGSSVGKSTLLKQLGNSEEPSSLYDLNIELSGDTIDLDGKQIQISIMNYVKADMSLNLSKASKYMFGNTNLLIFLYTTSYIESFRELSKWEKHANENSKYFRSDCQVVVMGNMRKKSHALKEEISAKDIEIYRTELSQKMRLEVVTTVFDITDPSEISLFYDEIKSHIKATAFN